MPAKSKLTLGQLALTPAPPVASSESGSPDASPSAAGTPAAIPPKHVEYKHGAEDWICERFDELVQEYQNVTPELLPRFQQIVQTDARLWAFISHLFELRPLILPAGSNPDDYRHWSRDEICTREQLTRPQLKMELNRVRGAWSSALRASAPKPEAPAPPPTTKPTMEFNLDDDPLIKKYRFQIRFSDSDEREWFVERIKEFEVVLREKIVSELAHSACLVALRLRRVNVRLDTYDEKDINTATWKKDYDLTKSLSDDYKKLTKEIIDLCPSASAIAGKMALQPVVSTITQALLEAKANNDARLIDGLFTAAEIQVECRMSEQMPEPKYRAGWVMVMESARQGIFDPQWTSPFPEAMVGHLDKAWKAAYAAAAKANGDKIPDLEGDGPESEYPDLYTPENHPVKTVQPV